MPRLSEDAIGLIETGDPIANVARHLNRSEREGQSSEPNYVSITSRLACCGLTTTSHSGQVISGLSPRIWTDGVIGRNHNKPQDSAGAYSRSTKWRQLCSHHLAVTCGAFNTEPSTCYGRITPQTIVPGRHKLPRRTTNRRHPSLASSIT
ncbi:hypothetical protein PoB_005952200 [Plakobranchus ocellatus]|uniref:Uncharacterized protein n=1 Tax=Plakobranchus ocellatus TaxID=259542 RepID=A0AAV4CMT6_9GAST|nr:hypothetical protein PoB_005952200 [Plakobranchus ocellatus]